MDQDTPNSTDVTNVLKSDVVPFHIDYDSLGKFTLDTLESNLDFEGLVDARTDEVYTYRKMRERSIRCALWMRSQGVGPGDVVIVCAPNQLDISMPCFAALYLGAIFNPLDIGMNAEDILHAMKIVKPKMAFSGQESVTAIAEAASKAKLDLKIIVFGDGCTGTELRFNSVIADVAAEDVVNFDCSAISTSEQTAVILCSSGTTGLPKAVALGHGAILRQLLSNCHKFGMSGNVCLHFSSIYWISGTLFMFMNLAAKVTGIVPPPFEEFSACALVEKYQVSWLFLSSSMITRLLKSGASSGYDLSGVKRVCYGGTVLASCSRQAFARLLPNALTTEGYGLTEVGGIFSIQSSNAKKGSCGSMIENAQLKVIDPETGRPLPANQTGELLLKTPCLMNFYYGNPEATAATIDKEGWLHSGDLGYYDDDGEIFVVDRMKELIKYRGYHVSPVDIENVILTHSGVKDVAVVGQPHPLDDEHPIAFVVRRTQYPNVGDKVTENDLTSLVAAKLADNKRLRGGVKFVDSLPRSPSDKIRRKELRGWAKSMSEPHETLQTASNSGHYNLIGVHPPEDLRGRTLGAGSPTTA